MAGICLTYGLRLKAGFRSGARPVGRAERLLANPVSYQSEQICGDLVEPDLAV